MDFAYLNAVAKSTSFPPYDPWFAGGEMNYYYFGFVQVAALAKLTGVPPVIAYNLAIPTLAGLLGAAVFSAAFGLAPARVSGPLRVACAVLAALFVTVLGNLGEIRVVRSALEGPMPPNWWFWNASRVIRPGVDEPGPITEFPAFTFIFGDLHAHAMALPVAALALALTVRGGAVGRPGGTTAGAVPRASRARARDALGDQLVGSPTYALLAVCGIGLATIAVDRTLASVLRFAGACAGCSLSPTPRSSPSISTTTPCTKVWRAGTAAAHACSTT